MQTRFAVLASGAVLDRATGLTWQRRVADSAANFAAAKASCDGLTVDGNGYRLPTLSELRSIVDDRLPAPVVDRAAFPDARAGWYFTASPYPDTKRFVWGVSMESGGLSAVTRSRPALYRCVSAVASPTSAASEGAASAAASWMRDEPVQPTDGALAANAVVREAQRSADRVTLRVAPNGWAMGAFQPGQTVLVGLSRDARRSNFAAVETLKPPAGAVLRRRYTIVSARPVSGAPVTGTTTAQSVEIDVRLRAGGALSPRLHALGPGDGLYLAPDIRGRAVADAFGERNLVLLASGVGITHYVSYLRTLAASPGACDGPRKIALLQSAPRADELFHHDELVGLARICKAFTYIPAVQKPELETPMWPGAKGRLEEVWAKRPLEATWGAPLTARDAHVSVCGNPEVIDTMLDALNADGFSEPLGDRRGDVDVCDID